MKGLRHIDHHGSLVLLNGNPDEGSIVRMALRSMLPDNIRYFLRDMDDHIHVSTTTYSPNPNGETVIVKVLRNYFGLEPSRTDNGIKIAKTDVQGGQLNHVEDSVRLE